MLSDGMLYDTLWYANPVLKNKISLLKKNIYQKNAQICLKIHIFSGLE